MSEPASTPKPDRHVPYVPAQSDLTEFSLRAALIGLVMCVVLGAANAYLGLKAGMTIAATYPAAVIGMAVLRLFKGTILEENMARTIGSIGESVAAGAIFTIPAFVISGVWEGGLEAHYLEATAIMMLGGIIGVLFVTLLRRVMVEDVELPFPESVAASEIHKAGRSGGTGAMFLMIAGGLGALIQAAKQLRLFAESWEKFIPFSTSTVGKGSAAVKGSGGMLLSSPGVSPAYIGVGYIIGPRLASLNFSGGLLAWGLFVPLLLYFMGPGFEAQAQAAGTTVDWIGQANFVWRFVVRPVAIGGMLVSAAFTLYRMRKSLIGGIARSVGDVKKAATEAVSTERTEKDIPIQFVLMAIVGAALLTFVLYWFFAREILAAAVAAILMLIVGFLFAAVSGYLVGLIGSSNNPISGLTLSTVIVAALLMVILGQKGTTGVAAVLGVAGLICVSAAVAGEMLQDLKVGHILGGTPWKMQVGDLMGVVVASLVMVFPLIALHQGDINSGGTGFGGAHLPAPQASLMALVSQGIVGGNMAWPLIIAGMLMAGGFILMQVKSPMLVFVGMYLPLETTFAIFIGGLIKGAVEMLNDRRKHNAAQKARVENSGVLLASGFIAGEALIGLVFAFLAWRNIQSPELLSSPSFVTSLLVFVFIAAVLIWVPIKNAGSPDEPAPPTAVM